MAGDGDVGRHFPAALAFVLDAQHQHGQAVEGEAPDHAKGVGLAQQIHVAAAHQNGEDLQNDDQVDDPVGGAESRMRLPEPVGENAVFRNAVENAVGTDDRGIDRARKDQEAHHHHEGPESQPQQQRAILIHGQAGDQVVFVNRDPHRVRNDHHEQQRREPGKDEAVNRDDDGGPLQVLQLGMGQLAVDLGQRFLAAHGQHGMAKGDQDAEDGELGGESVGQVGVLQKAQGFLAELQAVGSGQRHGLVALLHQGKGRPAQQDDHHHRGDLHYPQRLLAGFLNALGVLPPEVYGHDQGKYDRGPVDVEVRRPVKHVVHGPRDPAVGLGRGEGVVDQSGDVLSRRNARNRAGQDVIKHQSGNADLGQGPAQRLFDHAVNAAADEHGAALHVNRPHGEGEQHHRHDEPGRRLPDGLLGDAGGIEGGRPQVVQHDGRRPPVGDERQHH